jgi:hypothetical protein
MSPPRGSSMGLRSVRSSEPHAPILAICMFCTREPSFSHAAPCALFVSARETRHAFAFVGLAPKFFRRNHGAPQNGADQSEAAWQFQHLYKKRWCDAATRPLEAIRCGSGGWGFVMPRWRLYWVVDVASVEKVRFSF